MWKHYVVLFGGFYDPGFKSKLDTSDLFTPETYRLKANYLNDLWIFDTQEYKWKQIEFKTNERQPS